MQTGTGSIPVSSSPLGDPLGGLLGGPRLGVCATWLRTSLPRMRKCSLHSSQSRSIVFNSANELWVFRHLSGCSHVFLIVHFNEFGGTSSASNISVVTAG